MTLTELKYILAVAREGHFGRAAQACFVSQPTLSVAIRKLEDELGVQLFERGSANVSTTPIGQRVIEQARRTLEEADAIKEVAKEGRDQLSEPLRIGAIHTIGPYLFPELIPRIHDAAPDMPLAVEENFTARLTEKLRQNELDVILIALPFEEQGLLTKPIYEEPFVVLLPISHPLVERKTIPAARLEGEDLLLLGSGHCFREQVLEACPACARGDNAQSSFQSTLEGSSLETIRHMVATGAGITVVPCTAAGADRYAQRLLTIRRFAPPVPKRTVALAWRASFPRPKIIDLLQTTIDACNLSCVKLVKGARRNRATKSE